LDFTLMAKYKPTVPAPKLYEFVPLADAVFDVPWARWVNHDHPLKNGWCGELVVTATTHTPILVGGQDQTGAFFRVGDVYALSSTSVRGMLRSLLEIAAFARCTQIRNKPDPKKNPSALELRGYLPPCHSTPPARDAADFVETLLGYVDKTEWPRATARRGRAAVKDFHLTSPLPEQFEQHRRDLEGPQPDQSPRRYVDFSKNRVHGHKRFPVHAAIQGAATRRSQQFAALPASSMFTGSLVIHNVLPVELGGLLWALTWGGDRKARHLLGRAKPYGFGALTLAVDWDRSSLRPNDKTASSSPPDPVKRAQDWQTLFVGEMDRFAQTKLLCAWAATEQMKTLMKWACPPV